MSKLLPLMALTVFASTQLQAQQFGAYSAIRNGEILISEPVNRTDPATIYIYRRAGAGWQQSGTLMAPAHEGGAATILGASSPWTIGR